MMLRSSSTPVLSSLLSSSSFSESPNNLLEPANPPTKPKRLISLSSSPFHQPLSCNSSPSIYPDLFSGMRHVRSDGNLQGLAYENDELGLPSSASKTHLKLSAGKAKSLMLLETIPSFSFHGTHEDEDEEEEDDDDEYEYVEEMVSDGVKCSLVSNEEMREVVGLERKREVVSGGLFLARGIGINDGGVGEGGGGGGVGRFRQAGYGGDGGDEIRVEEHYKRMVEENPSDPLFLRNYAQFLHQIKEDLDGAEEYYSRAILLDPRDGDTLSQYAKLIWELSRDEERASLYFERAVHASPENSHVQAAYASFLWEAEEREDRCDAAGDDVEVGPWKLHEGAVDSANAGTMLSGL